VRPSLEYGIDIRITGRDRNDIKDYLGEVFELWLNEEIDEKSLIQNAWLDVEMRLEEQKT
jgi:hypothetical protein